jgi:hypothetical protein
LNVDEFQLAGVAQQHDAAGSPHLGPRPFPFALILHPAAEIEVGLGLAIGRLDGTAKFADVADLTAPGANVSD